MHYDELISIYKKEYDQSFKSKYKKWRLNNTNGCCSCNNINDPSAKLCFPGVVKNINIKVSNQVFNHFMSITNETRHIERHDACKCKCRQDVSVCSNKQRRNEVKCRCKCK